MTDIETRIATLHATYETLVMEHRRVSQLMCDLRRQRAAARRTMAACEDELSVLVKQQG